MRYLLVAALLLFTGDAFKAETAIERAERDDIFRLPKGDPEMAAAIRKARETLPAFLKLIQNPRPSITSFAVKVGIPEGNDAEFFWISPFERRKDEFVGRINNTPRTAKSVKAGQLIAFDEDDIVDWLYREDGRMYGNYTACVIIGRAPPAEAKAFMKQYGLRCE